MTIKYNWKTVVGDECKGNRTRASDTLGITTEKCRGVNWSGIELKINRDFEDLTEKGTLSKNGLLLIHKLQAVPEETCSTSTIKTRI